MVGERKGGKGMGEEGELGFWGGELG